MLAGPGIEDAACRVSCRCRGPLPQTWVDRDSRASSDTAATCRGPGGARRSPAAAFPTATASHPARKDVPEDGLGEDGEELLGLWVATAKDFVRFHHGEICHAVRRDAVRQRPGPRPSTSGSGTGRRPRRMRLRPTGSRDHAVEAATTPVLVEVQDHLGGRRQVRVEVHVGEEAGGVVVAVPLLETPATSPPT